MLSGLLIVNLSVSLGYNHYIQQLNQHRILANISNVINQNSIIFLQVINEEGVALGPNQEGELCLKGPLIMKGYVGDPKATAATIDSDGWLHTGDVAYYDEDKYFFIVDRLKELIKYNAYQVKKKHSIEY